MNPIDSVISTAKNIFYVVVSIVGWTLLFFATALYIFAVEKIGLRF